jgi:undecaprenyl-diphosphatase
VLVAWAAFAALAWAVDGKGRTGPDDAVMRWVEDLVPISDSRVHVEPLILAITLGLGVAIAALAARRLLARDLRAVAFAVIATLGVIGVNEIVRTVVLRRAIEGGGDESFPSGTATWTLGAAVICVLLLPPPWRRRGAVAAAILALAVAVIIVWEQWHYPTDVAGGWLLAAGWIGAAWLAFASERERGSRPLGELAADRE